MRFFSSILLSGLLAVTAASGQEVPLDYAHGHTANPNVGNAGSSWNDRKLYDAKLHEAYMEKVGKALGTFNDVPVFDWTGEEWKLLNGKYIPVTVDGETLDCFETDRASVSVDGDKLCYKKNLKSDRPMLLPIRVEEFQGGDGQSNPYTVVGRMPGTNPEVQWVFLVRKYYVKKPTDLDFDKSGDMAIIGHHPRTGASVFFQFYDPYKPKSGKTVVSPFTNIDGKNQGMYFWSPLVTQANVFKCERCHSADPFLHSPWINQVRVGGPETEPMVPSDPLGPYFFIDAEEGELFSSWNYALEHLDDHQSQCTQCHRVTPYDLAGLYQNSTVFAGLTKDQYNEFAREAHEVFQTEEFTKLHWMPPVYPDAFYAGQEAVADVWQDNYGASATHLNRMSKLGNRIITVSGSLATEEAKCKKDSTAKCEATIKEYLAKIKQTEAELSKENLKPVPAPPAQYREVMVNRPNQDRIEGQKVLAIIDSRMRANTDGTLTQWRFVAGDAVSEDTGVIPAVFRDVTGSGLTDDFEVVFLGELATAQQAGNWTQLAPDGFFDLKQGDYLGVFQFNSSDAESNGIIPYSEDEWAKVKVADGTTRHPKGIVTYHLEIDDLPTLGDVLKFKDSAYRTYSFEMLNKI